MLSPLLLKLPGMAWKAEECFPGGGGGGDCSSDDAGESLSDKGKVSFWFRLSSANFEDGGTGRIGIGLMGLLVVLIKGRFSTWLSPTCDTAESVTGKVDTGNPPRLWLKCGCGFGSGAVSWWTCSSSIKEPISCHSKSKKKLLIATHKSWKITWLFVEIYYVRNTNLLSHFYYRISSSDVKETRSPASPIQVGPP